MPGDPRGARWPRRRSACSSATWRPRTARRPGFDLADHVEALDRPHRRPAIVDVVLANNQLRRPGAAPTGRPRRSACAGRRRRARPAPGPRRRRRSGRRPPPRPGAARRGASSGRSSARSGMRGGGPSSRTAVTRPDGDAAPSATSSSPCARARRDRPVPAVRPARRGAGSRRATRASTRARAGRPPGRPARRDAAVAIAAARPIAPRRPVRTPSTGTTAAEHCRIGLAARPVPRPRLAQPGRRPDPPRVRRRSRRGADPGRAPGRRRAAGVVADPARAGRRDLEERRDGRDRSCAGSGPAARSSSSRRARSRGRCAAT